MGLHLCYELGAPSSTDPVSVLQDLRRFATRLPFAEVGPLLGSSQGDDAMSGASSYVVVDQAGQLLPREATDDLRGSSVLRVLPEEWCGFQVEPGLGCESATFGLARHPSTVAHHGRDLDPELGDDWRWHSCCKTQYASAVSWDHFMTVHGSLVSVLDRAGEAGLVREVRDETGFWSDRSWEGATSETERMNVLVRRIGRAIADAVERGGDT